MNEKQVSRRDFMKTVGVVGVGSLVGTAGVLAQVAAPPPSASPKSDNHRVPTRPFGRTGVNVSCLALGGIFDIVSNQLVLKQALDWGVTYWDTAAGYNGGKSELGIGAYFEKNPDTRKSVFLVTKASGAHTVTDMTAALNQSLERMKTDYVDTYFLHGINSTDPLTPEVKAWAENMKSAKKIRFFGFSTHSNMEQCLAGAARLGWIDVIMPMYNYRVMNTDTMKAAVDAASRAGIGLTAMKTQGKRQKGEPSDAEAEVLTHFLGRGFTREQACLKVVWEDQRISSICSQMPSLTVLSSNVAAALDKSSLAAEDRAALELHAVATRSLYCAGCTSLCENALDGRVPVGDVMRSLMYYHGYNDRDLARSVFGTLPAATRQQLSAMDYSRAERACPRGLPIASLMKEATELLA
ncbi:MAG TPA: aldo/keto reductase [Verrucomicrobiae bacterium]|nr:aldo/keto reductase [Verrucomicrobiae bacterium]